MSDPSAYFSSGLTDAQPDAYQQQAQAEDGQQYDAQHPAHDDTQQQQWDATQWQQQQEYQTEQQQQQQQHYQQYDASQYAPAASEYDTTAYAGDASAAAWQSNGQTDSSTAAAVAAEEDDAYMSTAYAPTTVSGGDATSDPTYSDDTYSNAEAGTAAGTAASELEATPSHADSGSHKVSWQEDTAEQQDTVPTESAGASAAAPDDLDGDRALMLGSSDYLRLANQTQAEHEARAAAARGHRRHKSAQQAPRVAFVAKPRAWPWPNSDTAASSATGSSGKKRLPQLAAVKHSRHVFAGTQIDFSSPSPSGGKRAAVDPALLAAMHAPLSPPPVYQQHTLAHSASVGAIPTSTPVHPSPAHQLAPLSTKKSLNAPLSSAVLLSRPDPTLHFEDPMALREQLLSARKSLAAQTQALTHSRTEALKLRALLKRKDAQVVEVLSRKIGEGCDTPSGGLQLMKSERVLIQGMVAKMAELEQMLGQAEEEKQEAETALASKNLALGKAERSANYFEQEAKRMMELLTKARANRDLSKFLQATGAAPPAAAAASASDPAPHHSSSSIIDDDPSATVVSHTLISFHQSENRKLLASNAELKSELARAKKLETGWRETEGKYLSNLAESRTLIAQTFQENESLRTQLAQAHAALRAASAELDQQGYRVEQMDQALSVGATQRNKLVKEVAHLTSKYNIKVEQCLQLATELRAIKSGKGYKAHEHDSAASMDEDAVDYMLGTSSAASSPTKSTGSRKESSKRASPFKGQLQMQQQQPPSTPEGRVLASFQAAVHKPQSPPGAKRKLGSSSNTKSAGKSKPKATSSSSSSSSSEGKAKAQQQPPAHKSAPAIAVSTEAETEAETKPQTPPSPQQQQTTPRAAPATPSKSVSVQREPEEEEDGDADYSDDDEDAPTSDKEQTEQKEEAQKEAKSTAAAPAEQASKTDKAAAQQSPPPAAAKSVPPPEPAAPSKPVTCDTCLSAAVVQCSDCDAPFCSDCFDDLHRGTKMKEHVTSRIGGAEVKAPASATQPAGPQLQQQKSITKVDEEDEDAYATDDEPADAKPSSSSTSSKPADAAQPLSAVAALFQAKKDASESSKALRSDYKRDAIKPPAIAMAASAPLCALCSSTLATVECVECTPTLLACEECDGERHMIGKARAHQRKPFGTPVVAVGYVSASPTASSPSSSPSGPPSFNKKPSFGRVSSLSRGGDSPNKLANVRTPIHPSIPEDEDDDEEEEEEEEHDEHEKSQSSKSRSASASASAPGAAVERARSTVQRWDSNEEEKEADAAPAAATPTATAAAAAAAAITCEICESEPASQSCSDCPEDMQLLCTECDTGIHAPKKTAGHKRTPLFAPAAKPAAPAAAPTSASASAAASASSSPPSSAGNKPGVARRPSVLDHFADQAQKRLSEPKAGPFAAAAAAASAPVAGTPPMCSNCDGIVCTIHCADGCGDLCDDCSREMHARGKTREHTLVPIGGGGGASTSGGAASKSAQEEEEEEEDEASKPAAVIKQASQSASVSEVAAAAPSKPAAAVASVQGSMAAGGDDGESSSDYDSDDE